MNGLVDPRPTHFNERGIMQGIAVHSSEDVVRESDDNDVVGGSDVNGGEVLIGDAVDAAEIRDREAVGGNDEGDEPDTVGGDDDDDEEDTVGGEDEDS
ncbi:MAG TPA: hypothetical protein VG246_01080 [Acidimicrobiales bacterium]|nr:hypothetical protein [Acidimicrobiales bacterium]